TSQLLSQARVFRSQFREGESAHVADVGEKMFSVSKSLLGPPDLSHEPGRRADAGPRRPGTRPGGTLLAWSLLGLLSLATLGGCDKTGLPPLAPVEGKVTVDSQALTSGTVSLVPLEKEATIKYSSSGQIESSGNYKIYTGGEAGAPLGKYK